MRIIKSLFILFTVSIVIVSCRENNIRPETNDSPTQGVSKQLAKSVALHFSRPNSSARKKATSNDSSIPVPGFEDKSISKIVIIPDHKDRPALYVVTFDPTGYIVVSGTKKEFPVLGYATDVTFDLNNLPFGLAKWFVDTMGKIQVLKYSEDMEIPNNVEEAWAGAMPEPGSDEEETIPGGTVQEQKGPLLQTAWSQGSPYNNAISQEACPSGGCPAGCVAVAMAQIMRFHEHPSRYDWSIMPNTSSYSDNTKGTKEIALLMRDIGEAVNMNYNPDVSGAYSSDAKEAFVNTFGYSNNISFEKYDVQGVVRDLKDNLPVYMDGCREKDESGWWIFKNTHYSGCHAWVADGFKRTIYKTIHNPDTRYEYTSTRTNGYYLHINWGWDAYNSWFKYDHLAPNDDRNYQYQNDMITDIAP